MHNLASLKEQIYLWSEREDLPDAQLDSFINLTEQNFKQDFFLPPNERIETLTCNANGQIPIPSDYLQMKHMKVVDSNGYDRPIYRKPNDLVVAYGSVDSADSLSYFERSGSYFIFAPKAAEGQEVTMTYYHLIPSLLDIAVVDPDQVNYVLAVMPTVYLFGALMFLFMYTFNEERAAYYRELYNTAKQDLIDMQRVAEMSGSSLHVVPTLSDNGSTW